jgi:predicted acylesterase/phospholipase RssA
MNHLASRPFGSIALSLSGGGYRAAAFHLGTLDVLERLGLLRDVRILSTVSGGTFTACRYALAAARGEPFAAFFASVFTFLARTNVIEQAVARLGKPRVSPRRHTLITAAADVYADPAFLGDARFGTLIDGRFHVRELILNATELRTGLAFRFQLSRRRARIGNRYVWIDRDDARRIRLADIVAASSCFPGAFEPIAFPEDWDVSAVEPPKLHGPAAGPELPLMDGGIYDNQGIQGLLLAAGRAGARGRPPGLFLASDTTQRRIDLFRFMPPVAPGWITVGDTLQLGRGLVVACLLSAGVLGWRLADVVRSGRFAVLWDLFTLGIPLLLTATLGGTLPWLWRRVKRAVAARYPANAAGLWHWLRRLPLTEILDLLDLRVRSLLALTTDVFMKRIRALGYARLYGNSRYEGRRIANLVYGLIDARPRAPWLAPSPAQIAVAERAAAVPTTLWFDDTAALRAVVACGQSTLCYNVLDHLVTRHGLDPAALPPAARALHDDARALWERLQSDPEALLRDRT